MQTAHVLLSLGGDHGNTVSKFNCTAAEIAVLMAIHGNDSVKDIEPQKDEIKRSHREERARLLNIYGAAKTDDQKPIVEGLFPGAAARVFERLDELDLDPSFFKATGRLSPDLRNDGPTIAEYVAAGYPASTYPPRGFASKSTAIEIAAAVAAQAPAPWSGEPVAIEHPAGDGQPFNETTDEDEDGVGDDIQDEHAEKDILA